MLNKMDNNKKYELLKNICDFFDYEVTEENGRVICHYSEEMTFESENIDIALCEWYTTLLESNENHDDYTDINRYTVWSIEDIELIRDIVKDKAMNLVASYSCAL